MKRTLVIGASENPSRYSNIAIHRLVQNNHSVVALGLRAGEVSGIPIHTEREAFEDIYTVTLYVGPKHQPGYYDYIVSLQPQRVIFNPGTKNPEFYQILKQHDIAFEVACTLVLLASKQY